MMTSSGKEFSLKVFSTIGRFLVKCSSELSVITVLMKFDAVARMVEYLCCE